MRRSKPTASNLDPAAAPGPPTLLTGKNASGTIKRPGQSPDDIVRQVPDRRDAVPRPSGVPNSRSGHRPRLAERRRSPIDVTDEPPIDVTDEPPIDITDDSDVQRQILAQNGLLASWQLCKWEGTCGAVHQSSHTASRAPSFQHRTYLKFSEERVPEMLEVIYKRTSDTGDRLAWPV